MKIGLIDVDGHRYPNIPLMKLSAWHRQQGDTVEWYSQMFSGHLDAVYMSKVFSFTQDYYGIIDADNIIRGGTGYCIELVDGKEVYRKEKDHKLPAEIEHIYPDYSLYPERTKDTAFGFLSRGCPRQCNFGHVAAKEGCQSKKVADLSEFFDGTKRNINLCDPNILACNEWEDLLGQLVESKAYIDFNQGIDVRLATAEKIDYLNRMKIKRIHLAWDNPKQDLAEHFKRFSELYRHKHESSKEVFVLTNFNSTLEEDLHRIYTLRELRFDPYVMIYDKEHATKEKKDLQRWVNNKYIWRSCKTFEEYGKHM